VCRRTTVDTPADRHREQRQSLGRGCTCAWRDQAAGCFLNARVGIWRAIVSSSAEASIVPSFELGAYVPLRERFDAAKPQHGASSDGLVFGIREDLDEVSYFTVFVGYALFLLPGY
jgi:hypothetical protein